RTGCACAGVRRSGRIFGTGGGGAGFEEGDERKRGGDFGWPVTEGPGHVPSLLDPIHAYGHDHGCCITGGAFYAPARPSFPAEWRGGALFPESFAPATPSPPPAPPPRAGPLRARPAR